MNRLVRVSREIADLIQNLKMETLTDCFGHKVRLTDERLTHILEHPEMKDMAAEIERVLRQPQLVRRSRTEAAIVAIRKGIVHLE